VLIVRHGREIAGGDLGVLMRSAWILALASLLALPVSTRGYLYQQDEQPIRRIVTFGDFALGPAETLASLSNASSVVLEGTIVATRRADVVEIADGLVHDGIRTAYRLGDISWIKRPTDHPIPDPVEFVLAGGRRQIGDTLFEYVDANFPAPVVGERYFLFLKRTRFGYMPALHGADSAFKVQDNRVVPVGTSQLSQDLAGADTRTLAEAVRGAVP